MVDISTLEPLRLKQSHKIALQLMVVVILVMELIFLRGKSQGAEQPCSRAFWRTGVD